MSGLHQVNDCPCGTARSDADRVLVTKPVLISFWFESLVQRYAATERTTIRVCAGCASLYASQVHQ